MLKRAPSLTIDFGGALYMYQPACFSFGSKCNQLRVPGDWAKMRARICARLIGLDAAFITLGDVAAYWLSAAELSRRTHAAFANAPRNECFEPVTVI